MVKASLKMSKKMNLKVTFPDGSVAKRYTDNPYTFVVAYKNTLGKWVAKHWSLNAQNAHNLGDQYAAGTYQIIPVNTYTTPDGKVMNEAPATTEPQAPAKRAKAPTKADYDGMTTEQLMDGITRIAWGKQTSDFYILSPDDKHPLYKVVCADPRWETVNQITDKWDMVEETMVAYVYQLPEPTTPQDEPETTPAPIPSLLDGIDRVFISKEFGEFFVPGWGMVFQFDPRWDVLDQTTKGWDGDTSHPYYVTLQRPGTQPPAEPITPFVVWWARQMRTLLIENHIMVETLEGAIDTVKWLMEQDSENRFVESSDGGVVCPDGSDWSSPTGLNLRDYIESISFKLAWNADAWRQVVVWAARDAAPKSELMERRVTLLESAGVVWVVTIYDDWTQGVVGNTYHSFLWRERAWEQFRGFMHTRDYIEDYEGLTITVEGDTYEQVFNRMVEICAEESDVESEYVRCVCPLCGKVTPPPTDTNGLCQLCQNNPLVLLPNGQVGEVRSMFKAEPGRVWVRWYNQHLHGVIETFKISELTPAPEGAAMPTPEQLMESLKASGFDPALDTDEPLADWEKPNLRETWLGGEDQNRGVVWG